jgi:hypothetical protein
VSSLCPGPAYRKWYESFERTTMSQKSLCVCDYPWSLKKNPWWGRGLGNLKVQWDYSNTVMGKSQLSVKVVHPNLVRPELVFHLEPGGHTWCLYSRESESWGGSDCVRPPPYQFIPGLFSTGHIGVSFTLCRCFPKMWSPMSKSR